MSEFRTKTMGQIDEIPERTQRREDARRFADERQQRIDPAHARREHDAREPRQATAQLKLTTEVRRNPWKLLYTPTSEVLEHENLYESARSYVMATSELELQRRHSSPSSNCHRRPSRTDRNQTRSSTTCWNRSRDSRRHRNALLGNRRPIDDQTFMEQLVTGSSLKKNEATTEPAVHHHRRPDGIRHTDYQTQPRCCPGNRLHAHLHDAGRSGKSSDGIIDHRCRHDDRPDQVRRIENDRLNTGIFIRTRTCSTSEPSSTARTRSWEAPIH